MSQSTTQEVTAQVVAAPGISETTKENAEALVLRLAEEMADSWRNGERPTAEEVLGQYSQLRDHPEAALRLACEEICLREEYGQTDAEGMLGAYFAPWRASMEQLLIAHRRQRTPRQGAGWPAPGETWADFYLVAELGRGAVGRVFLATQPALASRPVVLKISRRGAREHLSLARLQHTHVVPLYAVHDDPERNLLALCMPYFGGATLGQILELMRTKPVLLRTGQDILDALDRHQSTSSIAVPTQGPARALLGRASYIQAVCILGACLAEALKYAHERGLVHLDIKPANVLLAADAQPMLLDFHLARAPLLAGGLPPDWFGGTPRYMSPEQRRTTEAVKTRSRDFPTVDERSDLCSLGLVLYEALGGNPTAAGEPLPRLERVNPHVTTGLADIVHKCMEPNPIHRYADAGTLAADLNRYMSHRPLVGVRNRNLAERWRNWTRRERGKLARLGMLAGLLLALLMGGNQLRNHNAQGQTAAEQALRTAREQASRHQHAEALQTLSQGTQHACQLWWGGEPLLQQLREQIQATQRAQAVHTLRTLTDRVRFLFGSPTLGERDRRLLETNCAQVWEARGRINGRLSDGPGFAADPGVQADLLDLVLLWADLRLALAEGPRKDAARREILRTFEEAEALLGPSVVLDHVRQRHEQALGLAARVVSGDRQPRTAWDFFALGRSHLNAGEPAAAANALTRAVRLGEGNFWPQFYLGTCAYKDSRLEEAIRALCACVALRPDRAECYHNRALAYRAKGESDAALADFTQALVLDPGLTAAALNRGILHLEANRLNEARLDLELALSLGADPVEAHYNLAWVHHRNGARERALQHTAEVLGRTREHEGALALERMLRQE